MFSHDMGGSGAFQKLSDTDTTVFALNLSPSSIFQTFLRVMQQIFELFNVPSHMERGNLEKYEMEQSISKRYR